MGIPIDFFSPQAADRNEVIDDLVNIINLGDAPTAKEYLANAITAFFAFNEKVAVADRLTIFDIPRFMTDEKFRSSVLVHCHQELQIYFPPSIRFNPESINALLTRMSKLARYDELRTILGAKKAHFNIANIINENKVLFLDLRERSEPDAIVGSLVAAKIQHTIFSRANMDDLQKAKPYVLYIDECDLILKFAAERFHSIILRARKYNLWLTMACPSPNDLDEKIRNSLSKLGNFVIHKLNPDDARILRHEITPYVIEQLQNLPDYVALFRTNDTVSAIEHAKFLPKLVNGNADYVQVSTKRQYLPDSRKSEQMPHTSGSGKRKPEGTVLSDET